MLVQLRAVERRLIGVVDVAFRRRAAVLVVLTVLLGGCGTTSGSDPVLGDPPSSSLDPGAVTPSPGGLTGSAFGVSVVADAAGYGVESVIVATVVNDGPAPVYTDDQKSDCTVVVLQVQAGLGWSGFGTCGSERAPRTVMLVRGERLRIRIDLGSENFRPQPAGVGRYRLAFTFRNAARPQGSEPALAVSPTFLIG